MLELGGRGRRARRRALAGEGRGTGIENVGPTAPFEGHVQSEPTARDGLESLRSLGRGAVGLVDDRDAKEEDGDDEEYEEES